MVAIILLNYLTYRDTIDCIESLQKTTLLDYRVYVVDNNSPNESYEYLSNYYKDSKLVKVIKCPYNLGYAVGNNYGILHAVEDGFEYGIISNTDILFGEEAIDKMIAVLREQPMTAVVGPEIVNEHGEVQYEHKHRVITVKRMMVDLSILNRLTLKRGYKRMMGVGEDYEKEVFQVSGCCFAFKKELLDAGLLFDNGTFLGYEEAILGKIVLRKGLREYYLPCAKVVHNHKGPTRIMRYEICCACNNSEMYYAKKYLGARIPSILLLCFIRITEFMLKCIRDPKLFKKFPLFAKECLSRAILPDALTQADCLRIRTANEILNREAERW